MSNAEYSFISSTIIKQVAKSGARVTGLVTPEVEEALIKKFQAGSLNNI